MRNGIVFLVVYALAIPAAISAAEAGLTVYREGVEAFRAGDYNAALRHFQSARGQGYETDNLLYNLGVTYYKLRQFEQAERLFKTLMETYPDWRDLARYNLGLTALRRGDEREAERWFRIVHQSSDSAGLVRLAGEGLRQLDVPLEEEIPARRPDKTWLTLLSVGGGYDDNPLAFPELRQTGLTEEDEDFFVESLAYGQGYVRGNSGNGLRLHGFVYTKQYADLNIVDTSAFHGGLTYETSPGEWQVEYGAGGGHSRVDGSRLTNQVQGRLRVKRRGGRNEYSIQYRPVYHDADNAFFFLEGWQHKVDVRWRRHWDNARLTLRYRLEANDRDDRGTEDTFVSFSPLDNSILLETDWYPTPIWTFTAGAEYTNSDYDGKNRLTDVDGIFKVMERESEEIRAWAGIEYDLTPRWRLRAEYSYLNNDDNFRLYDYSRNEAKLTVEFTY